MTRTAAKALAAVLACAAQQVMAQDTPELEELIPDSAVEDPEGWAGQGVADPSSAAPEAPAPPVDPALADLPEITIAWPDPIDLPPLAPIAPDEEPIAFASFADDIAPLPAGSEERISDELVLVFPADPALFPERAQFLQRFDALSTIEQTEDDDNLAQLAAQARRDEELLGEMLRVYGYYDAQVIRSIDTATAAGEGGEEGERPVARFAIIPGIRYRFGAIDLGNIAAAGNAANDLRAAFEIYAGDPVSLDKVAQERADLDRALGETGFPFAAIEEPELLVDHDRREGDLAMPVEPGGQYNLGVVTSDLPGFLPGEHLSRIARWEPGELYRRSDEADLRRAILATGLVGSVTLTPVVEREPHGDEPGLVNIAAGLTPGPLRTISGNIGFGTEEGLRLEGAWEHRNMFPPEGMLRVRSVIGTREQLAGITFRKNNFYGRDRILTVDAFASTIDYDAFEARTVSMVGTFERVSTLFFQKQISWSAGLELVATQERERDADRNLSPRETFFIAALPLYVHFDESDDLLDPTRGWRLGARVSPEVSDNEGVQSFYVRSQIDASYYHSVGENTVLAGRVRLASNAGAAIAGVAPSRRVYAGGGGSVRGFGFYEIGPRNSDGDPTGGRSAVEVAAEARIRTGLLDGALSVVPFIDAGSVSEDELPDFRAIKFGAGMGVRYNTGFGPLRLDVAFPINPGPNDGWIAVYVALGQAF